MVSGNLSTTDIFLSWEATLCIVDLAASLTSDPWFSVSFSSEKQKCLRTLPNIPREKSHPWLRTAALEASCHLAELLLCSEYQELTDFDFILLAG